MAMGSRCSRGNYAEVLRWFADQGYSVAIAALESKKLTFTRHCS